MTVSPFDSPIMAGLLSDRESARLFTDEARIRTMLRVEAALARVEGELGIIPADAAQRIAACAEEFAPPPETLAEGTARDGVPIRALADALRAAVGSEAAAYVHWGATSQDIVDTSLVLLLGATLDRFEEQICILMERLCALAQTHRHTVMAARTRSQQATLTTFGLKAAGWLAPLARHRRRLTELRPRVLVLSFGGASGTLAALGNRGLEVAAALAQALDLACPLSPWHVQRDGFGELASWFSLISGTVGKMAQDVVLLSQPETAELREGAGGGSSTMPHKANPVRSEAVIALARFNATLLAGVHQSLIHGQERDGAAWQAEWLTLPQMAVATGAALARAEEMVAGLTVDRGRMTANIEASNGLLLAEAAVFILARHMPRPQAEALVTAACRRARAESRHLFDVLAAETTVPVDWQAERAPARHLGSASDMIDRILRDAKSTELAAAARPNRQ